MDKGKWFVRGASLAIVFGFFMPTVLVSCSGGLVDAAQSFSLANIAEQANQAILYLLPISFAIAAGLTFLRSGSYSQQNTYLWSQAASVSVGLLTLIGSMISLNDQIQRGTYGLLQIKPAFGLFVIIGGVIAFVYGWIKEREMLGNPGHPPVQFQPPPPIFPAQERYQAPQPNHYQVVTKDTTSYLKVASGNLPQTKVIIPADNFSIGRSPDCSLHLSDSTVSRFHAVIRIAQGNYFIQDQESTGGTRVNGERIDAIKLNEGDEIGIGPFRFIFHNGGY